MNKRLIIMLIACVVVIGGVFGVQAMLSKGINDFLDNMPMPAETITATEVDKTTWPTSLNAVGTAKAYNGTLITAEVPGIVQDIKFRSGDEVKKGDVLIQLDDETDRAQLTALEAAEKLAKTNLERTKKLHSQGSASASDLDNAQTQADQASGNLTSQQKLIGQKNIKAPFDGKLGIREVDLGDYLSPGSPIVSLQQLSPIYINFKVPESRLSSLSNGQKVDIKVDSWPDKEFSGKVTAIEPGIDASSRNIKVQAEVANEDQELRPGMFARVQVDLGKDDDVVVVPQSAISYNPYGDAVFVVIEKDEDDEESSKDIDIEAAEEEQDDIEDEDDTNLIVKRRFVKTGRTYGDFVAIEEGLEPGETIATSGLLKLSNDTAVKISDEVDMEAEENPSPDNT